MNFINVRPFAIGMWELYRVPVDHILIGRKYHFQIWRIALTNETMDNLHLGDCRFCGYNCMAKLEISESTATILSKLHEYIQRGHPVE
jgi:hypothetical protein